MTLHWFSRKGAFFLPSSAAGWIILLATVVYLVWSFFDIDSRSHSVSDTLMNLVFRVLIAAVVYSVIAFYTSGDKK